VFFLGQFCYVAKSDNYPQKDLARFAYKLNLTKQKALKHPSILLATILHRNRTKLLRFFVQIMAIENLKNH
jgi:hypothetical protein